MTDQTLDDLLSDPIILSVMKADRVDPIRLRADFARVALTLGPPRPARTAPAPEGDWQRLLADCLGAARRKAEAAGETRLGA